MKSNSQIALPINHQYDEGIWNSFKNGDKEAFSILYFSYFKTLIHSGLRITADKDLVKDCIHDLFVEIWKNKLNLSTPASVKAYLISSLRRKIVRHLVKQRSRLVIIEKIHEVDFSQSTEDQIIIEQIASEKQNWMSNALNCLTKRQKEAVYLKFYNNLSYTEISQMMSISIDSVYNLVSKAIDNLQLELIKVPDSTIH